MPVDETLCCQRGCHVNSLLVEGAGYNGLTSLMWSGQVSHIIIRIGTDLLQSTHDRC